MNHTKPYSKCTEWANTCFFNVTPRVRAVPHVLQEEMENEEEGNVRERNGEKE